MSKLSYKELQEMIPDYVFEQLTISEAEAFEQSIQQYPDLIQEVNDAKIVFGKINKIELTNEIEHKSRNISVKVNQKLSSNQRRSNFRMISRLALPTAALAVIVAMVFLYDSDLFYPKNNSELISKNSQIDELFELKSSEKIAILEATEDENDLIEAAEKINIASSDVLIENHDDIEIKLEEAEIDYLNEKLSQLNQESLANYYNTQFHFGSSIYNDIENLSEAEFQNLLEEIENEKII